MIPLQKQIKQKAHNGLKSDVFRNEDGAIDLASIMVGIIVIGLIGGVIAATVFAVIPWTQDNAAKQQLDSVVAAQSAYMGLASSVPPGTPAGHTANSYANSTKLEEANLMKSGPDYCAITVADGKGYAAFAMSDAGTIWTVTDKNTKPVIHTGTLPNDCKFITGQYVDPTPKLTSITYLCNADTIGLIPLGGNLTGTETWSDGVTNTYAGAATATPRTFLAGVTYTLKFEGTYTAFNGGLTTDAWRLSANCLTAVNHWGSETGVTSAQNAFNQSTKLTDVPKRIPTTITTMQHMLNGNTVLNDPDISEWDVSNVTNMSNMFMRVGAFNQPLDNWNTSKVTNMSQMFYEAKKFNQPLNNWDTSKVTNMFLMFGSATAFNGAVDKWNTSNVTDMRSMFHTASSFNQPIGNWDISKAPDLSQMFQSATNFNQPLNNWNTSNVTRMEYMFQSTKFFNQPLNNWNTANVTTISGMFAGASAFNQPLNNWNTAKVTNMSNVFQTATSFNQPLNNWVTTNVINMQGMFWGANAFNQPLNGWDVSKVTNMSWMFYSNTKFNQPLDAWNTMSATNMQNVFYGATAFNQPLNTWNTAKVTMMYGMFSGATAFNQPLNNWNTAQVANMSEMFFNNSTFIQDLSMWNQTALTNGTKFAPAATFPVGYKPTGTTLY